MTEKRYSLTALLLCACFLMLAATAQSAGDEWAIQTTSNPLEAKESRLQAISCAGSLCIAVGYFKNSAGVKGVLAEAWNGTKWTALTALNPKAFEEASLDAVSCSAENACTTTGSYEVGGTTKTLAERWDGKEWTVQSTPDPEAAKESRLKAVSCPASNACTATGYYEVGTEPRAPLAERWNGKEWTVQSTPDPEEAWTSLDAVACPSTSICMATGNSSPTGEPKPFSERWDGKEWEILTTPGPESEEAPLTGVSCASATNCFATGYYLTETGNYSPFAEHWDGKAWETQATPSPEKAKEAQLFGVSCLSTACMAVGTYRDSLGVSSTMAERWTGEKWEVQLPLNPEEAETATLPLVGISCTSTISCQAVGYYQDETGVFVTLAESYFKVEPPVNTSLPTVSPKAPETGVAETASTGTWTNSPTGYSYQWKRCNASGLECTNIGGATKSTYYPLAADVEHTLAVEVTASNSGGSGSANSKATEQVKKAGLITEYALPASSGPEGIAPGPDKNLWFTNGSTNKIGKITTAGSVTEYSSTEGSGPIAITKGPDGNLWFALASPGSRVGKISTAGAVTYYKLSKGMANGRDIAAGPDENIWFTSTEGNIGKITTSGTFTSYASSGQPTGISAGPDGNVWFTQNSGNKIVKTTTSGTMTEYSLSAGTNPWGIVSGPDEKLWFSARGKIGKITTGGTVTEYSVAGGEIKGITEGPDGLLWFAHYGADTIGKITTGGTVTEYSLPPGSKPWDVAAGSDGNVWFTESGSNRIGMISP